ncbi:MFS transporter [Actinomadura livida]|uniref:MFS transporter n=1 Tax=Actinomadura livida TaxID=79909 RepID=A0A7W7I9L2_9ACTN|nr:MULTISPECIES: MFS transporter [Actinomadura]MBB4772979.1 putative MFS family arabinose efflux permease [Actinomadura catellatispora]GGU17234.1 MFS transporter [Actinomadura livida]
MPRWLLALAAGALVFYTDDYVIAGVLPEIAGSLGVSVGTAGQLVTVFSVTVAVAAPLAAVTTARIPRRTLLVSAALVFTAANAGAALSPTFSALVALRVTAALAAAAATPAMFATAARLAAPERTGRAVAAVAFGVTGAIAFGVPAGAWIGGAVGWRATFAVMAAGGALVALGFFTTLPRCEEEQDALPVRAQLTVLGRPAISLGLLANVVLMFGSMMLLTYLAPFTAALANADVTDRGVFFACSGLAGMVGIWAGGRATDAWGADRTLIVGVGAFLATMVALTALWPLRPISVLPLVVIVTIWGGAAFWNSPAVQARLHDLAGPVATQALALNTSGTYIGVAIGGAVGGAVLDTAGPGPLPLISGMAGVVALALFITAARPVKASSTAAVVDE